jgi:hypothetical protein
MIRSEHIDQQSALGWRAFITAARPPTLLARADEVIE